MKELPKLTQDELFFTFLRNSRTIGVKIHDEYKKLTC